jgi:subtilisin family serine protease
MKKLSMQIMVAILLLPFFWQTVRASQMAQNGMADIDPQVTAALADDASVRVIVNLVEPEIQFSKTATAQNIASTQQAVLQELPNTDFKLRHQFSYIAAFSGEVSQAGLNKLSKSPWVASIQLDEPTTISDTTSLTGLQADIVQNNYGITGNGVTVAVVDTGIDLDHPDFSGRIVAQQCFTYGNCQPGNTNQSANGDDLNGHGTNVAGIIGSSGAVSVNTLGFAPDVDLVSVRVLAADGSGWLSDWVAGLDWIYANLGTTPVDIINMSLGTNQLYPSNCDGAQPAVASITSQLTSAGVTIFAATGNAGSSNSVSSPACNSNVIGVGATYDANIGVRTWSAGCTDSVTYWDKVTCFTNSHQTLLDILAPGALITSSGMGGGTSTFGGTSQASPTAAGVAALMLEQNPNLTPAQILQTMQLTGVSLTDPKNGLSFKRINARSVILSQPRVGIQSAPYGIINQPYTYTAVIKPFDASIPVTYTWKSAGFADIVVTNPTNKTASYSFATPGIKSISLTVENTGEKFSTTINFMVYTTPPKVVYLPLLLK